MFVVDMFAFQRENRFELTINVWRADRILMFLSDVFDGEPCVSLLTREGCVDCCMSIRFACAGQCSK